MNKFYDLPNEFSVGGSEPTARQVMEQVLGGLPLTDSLFKSLCSIVNGLLVQQVADQAQPGIKMLVVGLATNGLVVRLIRW